METVIIIVLLFMLLIAVIILLDINFDRKEYKIRIQDCASTLDKLRNENQKLQSKYQSALNEIFEINERMKSLSYQISKYDKCNKQIAQDLKLKNNVIEDAWSVIRKLEKEKDKAINQSQSAIKLCNKMANKFKSLNSELKTIESKLLSKLNP
jgi:chromosome segregation ATPase